MDAKERAKFINSVGSAPVMPVQETEHGPEENKIQTMGGGPVSRDTQTMPQTAVSLKEDEDAFAKGLPEWSLEPPQVVIRRRKRS